MNLCITLIADNLDLKIQARHIPFPDKELNLKRWVIYTEGASLVYSGDVCLILAEKVHRPIAFIPDSAFICVGQPETKIFADKSNYLLLDDSIDFYALIQSVNEIFTRYQLMEQAFVQSIYEKGEMQELVEMMYPFMNNEIVVMNSDFYFIAQTHDEIVINEISDLHPEKHGRQPLALVNYFKNDKRYAEVKDEKEPFLYNASVLARDCLCFNIFYNGKFSCRIVVSEVENQFRVYDMALLKFFGSYIQKMYDCSGKHIVSNNSDHFSKFLKMILNGKKTEVWQEYKILLQYGWKVDDHLICACILPGARDYYNQTVSYYCDSIMRTFKGICTFEQDDYIACLANLKYYADSEEQFFSEFVYYLREGYFLTGFSNTFKKLENLYPAWCQAQIALNFGIKNKPDLWNHKFKDYTLTYMLEQIGQKLDCKYICAPELLFIYDYDKEKQTEYYKTLKAYLYNKENAVQTAKQLIIHRGTMIYRLDRIKEMTGLTLTDLDELLYLHLSIRLFEKSMGI